MTIILNGKDYETASETTILALLVQLKLTPDKVAVELNKRLVRSAQYDRQLVEGDAIEVVTFVGGG